MMAMSLAGTLISLVMFDWFGWWFNGLCVIGFGHFVPWNMTGHVLMELTVQ